MADDTTTGSNTQNLNELLRQSPFGPLLDIEGVGGEKLTVEDIFGNLGTPGGGNAFSGGVSFDENSPYGGNPFAGDNFWNLFAGGVNPSNTTGSNPSGGGMPGAPSGGGGMPTGSSSGTPVNPFASDESFWEIFGGGVNPEEFSSSNIPAFGGGDSPVGLPGSGSTTPVPEPSSVLGLAVIGVGIAATKFRQHQRKTARVFNK